MVVICVPAKAGERSHPLACLRVQINHGTPHRLPARSQCVEHRVDAVQRLAQQFGTPHVVVLWPLPIPAAAATPSAATVVAPPLPTIALIAIVPLFLIAIKLFLVVLFDRTIVCPSAGRFNVALLLCEARRAIVLVLPGTSS